MIYFERSHNGVFASANFGAHLIRGVLAALFMIAAVKSQTAAPFGSFALGVAALVALRGCPVCWAIGLSETLTHKLMRACRERALARKLVTAPEADGD